MGRPLVSYLDTHTAVWLSTDNMKRISRTALHQMETSAPLISPVVLLEFQYLFEIKRITVSAHDLRRKLEDEFGVRVCDFNFSTVVDVAIGENWTREPFDRLIVAHAKANGSAPLVSGDTNIRQHYPQAVW